MKAGDKVVCVDNQGMEAELTLLRIYEVKRVQPGEGNSILWLKKANLPRDYFYKNRFILLEPNGNTD